MLSPAQILAVLAAIGHGTAYIDYNRKVFSGKTGPNGATWAIWSAIAVVSATSYLSASGDIWKCILTFNNIIFCIGTFLLALCRGKFEKLSATDWAALILGGLAIVIWKLSSAACANIIVQVAVAIGFIPTWRAVMKDFSREHPRPWWIWASAYSIAVIVVFARWKNQWFDLVYPVTGVMLHASVPVVAFLRKRRAVSFSKNNKKIIVTLES